MRTTNERVLKMDRKSQLWDESVKTVRTVNKKNNARKVRIVRILRFLTFLNANFHNRQKSEEVILYLSKIIQNDSKIIKRRMMRIMKRYCA